MIGKVESRYKLQEGIIESAEFSESFSHQVNFRREIAALLTTSQKFVLQGRRILNFIRFLFGLNRGIIV